MVYRDIKGDGFCDEPACIGGFTQLAFFVTRFARTSRRETAGFEEGGHSRCCTLRRGPGLSLLACG